MSDSELEVDADEFNEESKASAMNRFEMVQMKSKRGNAIQSDDDEDDDDEDNQLVIDDLIDDNPIEEDVSDDDESDDDEIRKRKKSDDEDDLSDRLEDDDYDLIEENLGVKVQRRKFKRVKRIEDEDSDQGESQDQQGHDRDAIANHLFEGSDHEEERREPVRVEQPRVYASDESDDSETDDFIVDDDGRPLKNARKKRKPVFNDATLQQAQDIFGVDFDYDEFEKRDEYEDEYENDEQRTARREKKEAQRRKLKSVYELYEPHELERAGFTDKDKEIRCEDVPERMQLRSLPITSANDEELDEESEWIYKTAFIQRKVKQTLPDGMIGEPFEANWCDDWDKQTAVPGPARTTVSVAAPAASEAPWEEDWDKQSGVPGPPRSKVNVIASAPSEAAWSENWDQRSAVSGTPRTTVNVPVAPPAAEAAWSKDWDNQTAVSVTRSVASVAAATPVPVPDENWDDEEDWTKPTKPVPPRITPLVPPVEKQAPIPRPPATAVGDDNWDEEVWTKPAPKPITNDSTPAVPLEFATEVTPPVPQEEVKSQIIPKIRKVLEFMRNKLFEVPFIAFYRKEYFQPELSIEDLWTIYRLDVRFCQLKKRKTRLLKLYRDMQEYQNHLILAEADPDQPISDCKRPLTNDDIERVNSVRSTHELQDMYMFYSLYYSDDTQAMKETLGKKRREERQRARDDAIAALERGEEISEIPPLIDPDDENEECKRKRGGRRDYGVYKNSGVNSFVKLFGLSSEKFAENLRDNYHRHEVQQYDIDPADAAIELCTEEMPKPDKVIQAAKFLAATEIAREPIVRQCVREVFFARATISCYPTKKGIKEIDEAHMCYAMKYLKNKPVREFTTDQFMKLSLAEDERLLTISLGEIIPGINAPDYIDETIPLFQKDEFRKNVQDWNSLRGECIEIAFRNILYPVIRKELRAKLMEDCKEYILKACRNRLHNWIKVAPYKVIFKDEDEEEWDTSDGIRVLAIAYVPDYEQAAFACIVGADGEPGDYLRLPNIIKSNKSTKESDQREKQADLVAVKNFVRLKKPHVIIIGGESREALMIQSDLNDVCQQLVDEDALPLIKVEIVDNQLARCYAASIKSTIDMREYPFLLKQAISLARRMQDPLTEFSQLCTADDEILALRFHMLQDHVPKDELLEHLYLEFVNRTNEVGVDVNRAINYPHTANLLQFICGLGRRKAAAVLKILKQNNQRLENRTQLITTCNLGPIIFINCSGFIKIDTNSLGDSTESYVELLDGSRVHPETYEWARKMAVDALEEDEDNASAAGALEEILDSPDKLKDLDLVYFAGQLELQGFWKKLSTLYDIRAELMHRYKDLRSVYEGPSPEEIFNMLTKETPETLYIGKLVTATVSGISHKKPEGDQLDQAVPVRNTLTGMWQCSFCGQNDFPELTEVWAHFDAGACPGQATGVRIRLGSNGIFGFIKIGKLSDSQVINPEERVTPGQTIFCRVIKIDVDRFSVECTSRSSDLLDVKGELRPPKDPYYDQEREDEDTKKDEEVRKNKQRKMYTQRIIVHPCFRNVSFREAELLMETKDQGEVVVRPSSKGSDHLTVTWKVVDGIYHNIDVREQGKENAFSLGTSLWIGNDEFEDLDEVIARHVNPMASHARELINFKYYVGYLGGSRTKAGEYLIEEKAKNGNKIHYVVQAARDYPGKFLFSYLPRNRVVHEYVTVTPEGFRFRQQNFDSFDLLLEWFKVHYRDRPSAPAGVASRDQAALGIAMSAYTGASRRPEGIFRVHRNPDSRVTTPRYTTPITAFTPYSTAQTPYTPTAQTPYITPYQTPRSTSLARANKSSVFLHPGAVNPTPNTSQNRVNTGRTGVGSTDWRDVAEKYHARTSQPIRRIKQETEDPSWSSQSSCVSSSVESAGGSSAFSGSSVQSSHPSMSPGPGLVQIKIEGEPKTKQTSSAHNYIGSGRESLKSTPSTNFSPRSMVESLGEGTPS